MYHALTQGIRTIKIFIKYKTATVGGFITENPHKKINRYLTDINRFLTDISRF